MNPYASYLGESDPLSILPESPSRMEALIRQIGPVRCEEPIAPGKWSVRQILCHLADCELAFGFRLRQARAEQHHVVQPFDQDLWAASYDAYDLSSALALYQGARTWNVLFAKSLIAEEMARPVTHPELGEMRLDDLLKTMAGHDLNHLRQLESLATAS